MKPCQVTKGPRSLVVGENKEHLLPETLACYSFPCSMQTFQTVDSGVCILKEKIKTRANTIQRKMAFEYERYVKVRPVSLHVFSRGEGKVHFAVSLAFLMSFSTGFTFYTIFTFFTSYSNLFFRSFS